MKTYQNKTIENNIIENSKTEKIAEGYRIKQNREENRKQLREINNIE